VDNWPAKRACFRQGFSHPDFQLRVMHFAQLPGTTKRSRTARSGTEQLFRSGKLLVPMVLLSHYALPVVTTSYFTTGRFNAQKEFEQHAASLGSDVSAELEPGDVSGSPQQWKDFRRQLDSFLAQDQRSVQRSDVAHFFKYIDKRGTPSLADTGAAWIAVTENGESRRVGISASNIVARQSDSGLAREFLLARVNHVLKSPARGRETYVEFQQDWSALQHFSVPAPVKPAPIKKDTTLQSTAQVSTAPSAAARKSFSQ